MTILLKIYEIRVFQNRSQIRWGIASCSIAIILAKVLEIAGEAIHLSLQSLTMKLDFARFQLTCWTLR